MATRTDEPLIVRDPGLGEDDAKKAEEIRTDIAETRNHMARTVDAIEERLSPKNIKAQVSSVKEHLLGEIKDAKSNLLVELKDAKSTIKDEVQTELSSVKNKVRKATVGRVENMVSGARSSVTNAGSTTIDTVKTNPIPAALVAVGLGWLIVSGMKGRRSSVDSRIRARSIDGIDDDGYAYSYDQGIAREHLESSTYGREESERPEVRRPRRVINRSRERVANVGHEVAGKARDVSHDVADKAKGIANGVAERAEHFAHDASNMAHDASNRARTVARDARVKGKRVIRNAGTQARRMEQGFERELRSNPIPFGAVALAIGAAIGLLLPHTQVEDRLVGEKKDRLMESARSAAKDAISSFQEKAGEITSNLKSPEGSESQPQQGYANGISKQNGLSNGIPKQY